MIKIMQIFDQLGFIDISKPDNLEKFLEMFNSNFLDIVPNPFSRDEYEADASGDGKRLLEHEQEIKRKIT